MNFARRLALTAAFALLLPGCYTVKYYSSDNADLAKSGSHLVFANSFFWGLLTVGRIDLDKQCGKTGVKTMRSRMGGWTLFANWLTAGIWSPMQVRITCAARPTADAAPGTQYGWADLDEGALTEMMPAEELVVDGEPTPLVPVEDAVTPLVE